MSMRKRRIQIDEANNLVYLWNNYGCANYFKVKKQDGNFYLAEVLSINRLKQLARLYGMTNFDGKTSDDLVTYIFGDAVKPLSQIGGS